MQYLEVDGKRAEIVDALLEIERQGNLNLDEVEVDLTEVELVDVQGTILTFRTKCGRFTATVDANGVEMDFVIGKTYRCEYI